MSNRLRDESSPYLRQHEGNPVHWYPFGAAAFAAARESDRPILLSIGYSACHWCHVMAHESFEDAATAEDMNRWFINIKVDREEHPDVDQLYQHALQLFGEGGGWPLTMFLTPSGDPFYGGTYFPPQDRYGRPSFRRVLAGVARSYAEKREQVDKQGREVLAALVQLEGRAASGEGGTLPPDFAQRAAARLLVRVDPKEGGFEGAPKFPNATALSLQLRAYARSGDEADVQPALLTLRKMAAGGIYDHLGGGFARYSTDAMWLVPHFEKMLYDNAQLLKLYAEGHQIARQLGDHALADTCARVILETHGWLEREMRDQSGGCYAAQDADSEGVEGKYFVFTPEEVEAACGPELGRLLCRCYDVRPGGNWRDPHGHAPAGSSILHPVQAPADAAEERDLAEARARLLAARRTRVPPGTDDKVLTGWNGLLISGLSVAGAVLGEGRLLLAARRSADFALSCLRGAEGALWRTFKHGVARLPATLDDHAFLAEGLFHLASASGELTYLAQAERLMDAAVARFYEEETGTFYLAPQGEVPLVTRPTSLFDSAVPSGASVSCLNLLRLAELGGRADLRRIAERTLRAQGEAALRNPFGLAHLCAAADLLQHGLTLMVLRWPGSGGDDAEALRRACQQSYLPDPFVLGAAEGALAAETGGLGALLQGKELRAGRATAYVCHHQRCEAPVNDEGELRALLQRRPLV